MTSGAAPDAVGFQALTHPLAERPTPSTPRWTRLRPAAAKEDFAREDHDYGLSWIRKEGQGRVFYEAHGHVESVYADRTLLLHLLAGVQYAAGDLKANDAPSER